MIWPFLIDCDKAAGASDAEYIEDLKRLIAALHQRGYRLVPACDFEDELKA